MTGARLLFARPVSQGFKDRHFPVLGMGTDAKHHYKMTMGPGVGVAMTSGDEVTRLHAGSLRSGERFYIAILLFQNLFINFMHRINLSVAASYHDDPHAAQL